MNMNQTTSPALSQVETAIRVPAGNFAKYNYYSVFDIVRQTRKQFINANMSWPGSRGGKPGTWRWARRSISAACSEKIN